MSIAVMLCGGFGEKGRTALALDAGAGHVLFDAGIKVGASPENYHPRLPCPADRLAALFISHAHEDHIGALPHLFARGFRGPVYMTAETRDEMPDTLAEYADPRDLAAFRPEELAFRLIRPGDRVAVAGLDVTTGDSGHVLGGLWFHAAARGASVGYSADVVPHSTVFAMTPQPACDLLVLDCSYGVDDVPGPERARAIAAWVRAHPGRTVLPTPLSGRSLELMAVLPGPFAIAAGMRAPLARQIEGVARPDLAQRLTGAADWAPGQPLPGCPLLAHDGMGQAGPSAAALRQAVAEGAPILLSGHLPEGSPGQRLHAEGRADWLRMPTHPTICENRAIWEGMGAPRTLGHSCPPEALNEIARAIPTLDVAARTGDRLTVTERKELAHTDRQR